jgi:poly-gamma-glutamate capsule biosynthesis protein CapA/YwtB (metallophosphatase superfamily)
MGYAEENYQPSLLELARSGNFRAIAYWLNASLLPHHVTARVAPSQKPGCLRVFVEFEPSPNQNPKSPEFRKSMVRFICRHLWQLNSEVLDGVQVIAKHTSSKQVLWRQAVRVVSPARRARLAFEAQFAAPEPPDPLEELAARLKIAKLQQVQFRTVRSLLLSGSTAAVFILGCWLGLRDAPEQMTASTTSGRPDKIMAALEKIPVRKIEGKTKDPEVSLMFGGDVALTESYSNLVGDDRQWAFSQLNEYRQADVAMLNLEAPFTTANSGSSDKNSHVKADPAKVEVLKNGGVDLVNLANDRTMDYSKTGLEETLKTLEQAGIESVGAGLDQKMARRPEILDVKGQRIAYLGYQDSDLHAAKDSTAGINSRQNDRIAEDIKALRDQVDWVIVNYHWGEGLSKYPSDRQIELARFTIDHGADLVVGHHSEVLQGAEIYKGRPIVYSLGNFIFGEKSNSEYDTAVLKVALKDKQMKVELLPVEVKGFQPKIATGDRGTEILQQVESVSDTFKEPLKSPVVLDARTPLTAPTAQPQETLPTVTPSPIEIPSPSPEASPEPTPAVTESPSPEAQPSEQPSAQPSEQPSEGLAPASEFQHQPSPVDSPAPESAPTPSESPASTAEPTAEPTSEPTAEPTSEPTAEPSVQPSPDPSSTPSGSTPEAPQKTWGDDSSVFPNSQPSPSSDPFGAPMVPQQAEPTPPTDNRQGDASSAPTQLHSSEPTLQPSPVNSLEPRRRRYASSVPSSPLAHVSLAPNL